MRLSLERKNIRSCNNLVMTHYFSVIEVDIHLLINCYKVFKILETSKALCLNKIILTH